MYLSEGLQKKWAPLLDATVGGVSPITDPYRRAITSRLLENTEKELKVAYAGDPGLNMSQHILTEEAYQKLLTETLPANYVASGGYGGASAAGGPTAGFDPILISLIRRSLPNLIAYDVCGIQPMTGPTGLIFAMRSIYSNGETAQLTSNTPEALYNEANDAFSGNGTFTPFDTANVNPGTPNNSYFGLANTGYGLPTNIGEDLQIGGNNTMGQMGFSIE
ncbi:MAG: hypothetical protein ACRDFB_00600, partial [Rhabdochlamydiaceae bacterium]